MRFALPLALFATPALAHPGPHMHPHGSEGMVMLLLLVGGAAAAALWALRK